MLVLKHLHFLGLIFRLNSKSLSNTGFIHFNISSIVRENANIIKVLPKGDKLLIPQALLHQVTDTGAGI